jgi:hypothetical protein
MTAAFAADVTAIKAAASSADLIIRMKNPPWFRPRPTELSPQVVPVQHSCQAANKLIGCDNVILLLLQM